MIEKPEFERLESLEYLDAVVTSIPPEALTTGMSNSLLVEYDNTGLGGQITDGIDSKLFNIPAYATLSEAKRPSQNDFFGGLPMFFETFNATTTACGRLVRDYGSGPINSKGIGVEYVFDINNYGLSGPWNVSGSFSLSSSAKLYSPDLVSQPRMRVNLPFTIVPYIPGDADMNNKVDAFDYIRLKQNMGAPTGAVQGNGTFYSDAWGKGDFNSDGVVDAGDVRLLTSNMGKSRSSEFNPISGLTDILAGTNIPQNTMNVPEPATLSLLAVAGAIGVMGRGRRKRGN